jgi:hypothetical protein
MALGPREFVEEVDKFFDVIEQRRNTKRTEAGISPTQRIKFGQIDLSDINNELVEITVALHRLFITQQSINNLSSWDTIKVLKKAKIIALASISQFFKDFNNKEESNFWQFFTKEAGLSINDNFYHNILEPALIDENIIKAAASNTDTYTNIIAKESYFSAHILEDIIILFKTYWKYFYPNMSINDYMFSLDPKNKIHPVSLMPRQANEKEDTQRTYKRIFDYKEKVIMVIEDLLSFTNYLTLKGSELSNDVLDQEITNFQNEFNYDISYIFKSDELKESYLKLLPSRLISHLVKMLRKEAPGTVVTMPDLKKVSAEEILKMEELQYGIYIINDRKYSVLPSQSLDISYFAAMERDKIMVNGNKVIIRSFHPFMPHIGVNKALNKPLKLFKEGKLEGYLWYANKPLLETLTVTSEKVPILPLEPHENIISDLSLKLMASATRPHFELDLAYLLLVSGENKGKKIEIINTDQLNIFKEFSADAVAYSGQITYPVKNKAPGSIDLLLVSNKEPLSLKEFLPRLTIEMDETMLFDGKLKRRILPSERPVEYVSSKLYMFTTRNFENKWVSDVCEVSSFQNFGDYNVYEIDWLDKSKALEINIENDYKWTFLKALDISVDPRETNYNNKFIEFKNNQFLSFKDVNLIINCKDANFPVKNLEIKTSMNYDVVSSQMQVGAINSLLERNENHTVIDELFIRSLLPNFSELSYGRFDFEFSYHSTVVARIEIFIIPELTVDESNDVYIEDDELILTLRSQVPCFRNRKVNQSYLFDNLARNRFTTNSNKLIESKKIRYYKRARLYNPYTELYLRYEPEVIGYRFIQDSRLYTTDLVDFYNLDKTSIAIRASQRDVRLKVNSNVVKPMTPNNNGIIVEPLKSIKEYLSKPSNYVSIQMGRHDLSFQVLWNSKVTKLAAENILFSPEEGLTFSISYEGPSNAYLKFYITDADGKNLEVKKIFCGEDMAPKFVRYDRHKNCIFLTCDGRRWDNRSFTIHLEPKVIADLEFIYLKGIYEYNNATFGELFFRNEKFDPDIQKLNNNIKQEPENPYFYFERGFEYSERNQFVLADQDFNTCLKLGLDDQEALGYIALFKESLANNLLTYELSQITRLARKLYTEELLLDVE